MAEEDLRRAQYEMAMPFVVCRTQRGPYEDDSFVAGWEACYIDMALATRGEPVLERWVYPALVPQVDLIAMRHGYEMSQEPWEEDPMAYAKVVLTRVGTQDWS